MFKPTKKQHVVNKAYADSNSGGNVATLDIAVYQRNYDEFEAWIRSGNVNDVYDAIDSDMLWDIFITGSLFHNDGETHGMDILHVREVYFSEDNCIIRAYGIESDSSTGPVINSYTITVDMDGNVTMRRP